jgi:YtkA-like
MTLPIEPMRLHSGMLSSWYPRAGFFISLVMAACGNGGTGNTSAAISSGGGATIDTDGAVVSCKDDPRVDTYVANMAKPGQRAVLTFTLIQSDPAPPGKGNNVFKVKITKADGSVVTGDVIPDLKMPDHGHPSSVKPVATFDPATQTYTVDPTYLFMAGVWRIQLDAYEAAAVDAAVPLDSGVFFFCVEG